MEISHRMEGDEANANATFIIESLPFNFAYLHTSIDITSGLRRIFFLKAQFAAVRKILSRE